MVLGKDLLCLALHIIRPHIYRRHVPDHEAHRPKYVCFPNQQRIPKSSHFTSTGVVNMVLAGNNAADAPASKVSDEDQSRLSEFFDVYPEKLVNDLIKRLVFGAYYPEELDAFFYAAVGCSCRNPILQHQDREGAFGFHQGAE